MSLKGTSIYVAVDTKEAKNPFVFRAASLDAGVDGCALKIQSEVSNHVICINNGDYKASLEIFKIYRQVHDDSVKNYIRIIDEDGEDYLYPKKYFIKIRVPKKVKTLLSSGAELS